jgi:hypothetical protein
MGQRLLHQCLQLESLHLQPTLLQMEHLKGK